MITYVVKYTYVGKLRVEFIDTNDRIVIRGGT